MKIILLALSLGFSNCIFAFEQITKNTDAIIVYSSDEKFNDSVEFIRSSIADAGLKITSDLHIGNMLAGTEADTGLVNPYIHATALEFCSISLAHAMATAHPANMSVCPLTLNVYQVLNDKTVYVAFKHPFLLGDGENASNKVIKLMDSIVRDALN